MRLLDTEKEKKLIGHCARLRENDDLPTHEPSFKGKAAIFLMYARWYTR